MTYLNSFASQTINKKIKMLGTNEKDDVVKNSWKMLDQTDFMDVFQSNLEDIK